MENSEEKAILSVVRVIGKRTLLDYDEVNYRWNYGPVEPVDPSYIASGGGHTTELQKAQIFGFSKSAQKNLDRYRVEPELYQVIPVRIVIDEER